MTERRRPLHRRRGKPTNARSFSVTPLLFP